MSKLHKVFKQGDTYFHTLYVVHSCGHSKNNRLRSNSRDITETTLAEKECSTCKTIKEFYYAKNGTQKEKAIKELIKWAENNNMKTPTVAMMENQWHKHYSGIREVVARLGNPKTRKVAEKRLRDIDATCKSKRQG